MASPSMTMNKTIHCAVRRDLARFKTALAAFPDGDAARAEALHRAWRNFEAQLTEHHEGEHEIAWPAFEALGVPQAVVTALDDEHSAMAAALAATATAMAALAQSPTRESADKAVAAMNALDHATATHLDHEEREVEQLLLEKHDDPVVKDMGRKFSRRSGLGTAGTFFAWMEDGASPAERAALRESVPSPVIMIIAGLFGRRYRKEVAPVWAMSGSH